MNHPGDQEVERAREFRANTRKYRNWKSSSLCGKGWWTDENVAAYASSPDAESSKLIRELVANAHHAKWCPIGTTITDQLAEITTVVGCSCGLDALLARAREGAKP